MDYKKNTKRISVLATGTLLIGSLSALANTNDVSDIFRYNSLGSGAELRTELISRNINPNYFANTGNLEIAFADKTLEGKCGEGKCGEKTKSTKASKKSSKTQTKAAEHKCGEGKCGEKVKSAKNQKTKTTKMKSKSSKANSQSKKSKTSEGKCGEGKCGAS